MELNKNTPSRWALAFFNWYCRPEFREEIEGDLMERFSHYEQQYGYSRANRLFVKEVILLFRPTIVGNFYQLTNTAFIMNTEQNKRLAMIVITAFSFLLIPLIAMNFTNEVNWKIFDFLVAGLLLVGTGFLLELILRKIKSKKNRIILSLVLFTLLLLLWAELAVGIFGTPIAGS